MKFNIIERLKAWLISRLPGEDQICACTVGNNDEFDVRQNSMLVGDEKLTFNKRWPYLGTCGTILSFSFKQEPFTCNTIYGLSACLAGLHTMCVAVVRKNNGGCRA